MHLRLRHDVDMPFKSGSAKPRFVIYNPERGEELKVSTTSSKQDGDVNTERRTRDMKDHFVSVCRDVRGAVFRANAVEPLRMRRNDKIWANLRANYSMEERHNDLPVGF